MNERQRTVGNPVPASARGLRVRLMAESDLEAVVQIQDACYTSIVPESRGSLRAKLLVSPRTCLVAETQAGVVGYAIAVPVKYPQLPALDAPRWVPPPDSDTLYLHDVAVSQEGRGNGAGAAMVAGILTAAEEAGWSRICLVAIQGSVPYWSRFGFRLAPANDAPGKLASYGADAQLMRRAYIGASGLNCPRPH